MPHGPALTDSAVCTSGKSTSAGGDAGSEGLDADTGTEAEAAAAAAAEAADFDRGVGRRRGGDSGGGAFADPNRGTGDGGAAATPLWAAPGDSADAQESELSRPPDSDPGAAHAPASTIWFCRSCGRADTQFGDPVTLQFQHRTGRQAGCCWHTACLQNVEERRRTARPHPPPLAVRVPAAPTWRPARRPRHGPPRRRSRRLRPRSNAVKRQCRLPSRDRCVLHGPEVCCQCKY